MNNVKNNDDKDVDRIALVFKPKNTLKEKSTNLVSKELIITKEDRYST